VTLTMLSKLDTSILMELQYRFPLTETPYCDVAERLGVGVRDLLEKLRLLRESGVLKRVGYYFNHRSAGKAAALVAYATRGDRRLIEALASHYRGDHDATHVYLRDHPVYDVWVVVKRSSRRELEEHVSKLAESLGVGYAILYSSRTYKLSVKYDLERGVSRAGPYSMVRENPPRPEDLGYPSSLAFSLRVLPLEERPYKRIAASHSLTEAEVVEAAKGMLEAGVLGDPGAALDGWRAGFRYNAMTAAAPSDGDSEGLCKCVASKPQTTHVVLREPVPAGAWRLPCFFVIHAVSDDLLKAALDDVIESCGIEEYQPIRSLEDLKPGALR
jgi:DNA-binding Lrp family transcriptional regulator